MDVVLVVLVISDVVNNQKGSLLKKMKKINLHNDFDYYLGAIVGWCEFLWIKMWINIWEFQAQ